MIETGNALRRAVPVWAALVMVLAAFLVSACGRKAVPVPPRHLPPPTVQDLAGLMDHDRLILTWTLPAGDAGTGQAESLVVYWHRSVAGDAICPGCPPIFTPLATVAVDDGQGSGKGRSMVYRTELEKGYRYLFKVVALGRDSLPGLDSNLVRIDH